jgi:predicted lipid-binding transport protein (Tim44 family)
MYGRHEHGGWGGGRGGGWGNPRWGGGWGGGPFVGRRVGTSFLGGLGMGGLGMGGGGGLIGDLIAGGMGYLAGKNSSQNQSPYPPQYQQYPPQYQQATPQYQPPVPQYQPPVPQYQPAQGSAGGVQDGRLAQLNLLGQLREQGILTDAEFQAEKQKILNG